MMLIAGQSNRIWHYWAGKYPGSFGVLIGPSYGKKVPIDRWMPFVLDNDAFTCWKIRKPWSYGEWIAMIDRVRMTRLNPLWAIVPDAVGDREKTLENWGLYHEFVKRLGWNAAFAVQDGMTPDDVPSTADVVFVGGTDSWKFPNLKIWTDNFPRVHCARVTSQIMIERCEELGCESIDGTGWFRAPDRRDHLPMLQRFIEGHRDKSPQLFNNECEGMCGV